MADFFSGMAEGLQAGSNMKARRQRALLDQEKLGMAREKMSMDREKFEFQKETMREAKAARLAEQELYSSFTGIIQQKGVGAGLDFLMQHKPKEALAMKKTIADTKKSIADTMKTQAEIAGIDTTNKKKMLDLNTQALDMIAGAGKSLLRVPIDERPQVFEAMLPRLKLLDKNFPDNFKDAKTYFQAASGLAMPQSKIYDAEQDLLKSQSDIIKAVDYLGRNPHLKGKNKAAIEAQRDKGIQDRLDAASKRLEEQLKLTENKEDKLRAEYTKLTKDFRAVQTSKSKAVNLLDLNTAAGDHGAIFAYMKVLDPGSTVREGEYATAEQTGSIPNWLVSLYNRTVDGRRLTPEMRDQFKNAINTSFSAQEKSYDMMRDNFVKIATDRGLDLTKAIPDYQENKARRDLNSLNLPPELRDFAKKALDRGVSMEQIKSRLKEMK